MNEENKYQCGLYAVAFVLIMGFAIITTALESLGLIEGDRGREDDVEIDGGSWDRNRAYPHEQFLNDHKRNDFPSAREANGWTN